MKKHEWRGESSVKWGTASQSVSGVTSVFVIQRAGCSSNNVMKSPTSQLQPARDDEEAAGGDVPLLGSTGDAKKLQVLQLQPPTTALLNATHGHHRHNHHNTVTSNASSVTVAGGLALRVRHRSGGSRKPRRRVVFKNGECNVVQTNISKRRLRYLQDIFTTLVDVQWRWTLLVFALSFVLSWLGFAVIWWLIAFSHGDFEHNHLPDQQEESQWTPCVVNIFNFASCFLFSVETQHTIGYGSRSTTEECPEAIFIMCLQSITGVMIQAFMVGIVFAKMSRPKKRTQTLLFSRNAVICQRDGQLCLMFRVGDMRKSHIIGAGIRAQLIRSRQTKEGEVMAMYQHELIVGADSDQSNIFFIWPMTVVHRIDSTSPLYSMSASDMIRERFEIVVILEGCIESTGQTTQARSSYLPAEVLWGHRFQSLVSFSKERGGYEVDYSLFNNTYEVETPLCSARDLEQFNRIQEELRTSVDTTTRLMGGLGSDLFGGGGGGLRRVTSEPGGQSGPIGGVLQRGGVPLLALDQTPESPDDHL